MAALQRWQQWLLRRQQPEDGAPGSAAAAAADAAAAQLGHAPAGGSSDQTSDLSSSGGPSAPPSAPGSIAGSGEWPKAGGGIKAPVGRSSLGMPSCSGPGSSSCSYGAEPGQDDLDNVYGADELTLRSAWRRTETWLAAYILAALLVSVCINIGVGASNSARRNRVQLASVIYPSPPPPAPPGAWPSPPPSVPAVPPPLPAQPQPLPSAPPAVLPPLPPPPVPSLPLPSPAVPLSKWMPVRCRELLDVCCMAAAQNQPCW